MDRLEAMTVFVAAVDGGSLSAAGRQLRMPLATVSRKLSDLEAHLRARLLHRSTRKLTLTDAGRDYYASCKRILEDVGDAERDASGEYAEPRGELVIAAPIVFGRVHVLPVIAQFLAAYPEVDVRLVQGDRNANLLEDHLDLAVRIGALPDSSMTATAVGSVRRVVCASAAYLAARGTPQSPDELAGHCCVSFDALGAGITRLLSYQVAQALQEGRLQRLLPEFESTPAPVNLLFDGRRRLPLKLRAFIDFATPRLRERLAKIA